MTSDFNSHNSDRQPFSAESSHQPQRSIDVVQRDRFEMLSAYLDGEVTAEERKQVEEWLANDPTVQRLHSRLLNLRSAFQAMPVPSSEQSVQQTVDAVFAKVDRRPRLSVIWGGAAIAALLVGAVTTVFLGDRNPMPQLAQSTQQEAPAQPDASEPLLVALDKPLVAIPKTPVAAPVESAPNTRLAPDSNDNVR